MGARVPVEKSMRAGRPRGAGAALCWLSSGAKAPSLTRNRPGSSANFITDEHTPGNARNTIFLSFKPHP